MIELEVKGVASLAAKSLIAAWEPGGDINDEEKAMLYADASSHILHLEGLIRASPTMSFQRVMHIAFNEMYIEMKEKEQDGGA